MREFDLAPRGLGSRWSPVVYPFERLMEESAFIAYHFHWPLEQVLGLEHLDRRRWAQEISRINDQINKDSGALVQL